MPDRCFSSLPEFSEVYSSPVLPIYTFVLVFVFLLDYSILDIIVGD